MWRYKTVPGNHGWWFFFFSPLFPDRFRHSVVLPKLFYCSCWLSILKCKTIVFTSKSTMFPQPKTLYLILIHIWIWQMWIDQCHTNVYPEMAQHNHSKSANMVPLRGRWNCPWGAGQQHLLRSDESHVFSSYHHGRYRAAQEVWGPVISTSEHSSKCMTVLCLT